MGYKTGLGKLATKPTNEKEEDFVRPIEENVSQTSAFTRALQNGARACAAPGVSESHDDCPTPYTTTRTFHCQRSRQRGRSSSADMGQELVFLHIVQTGSHGLIQPLIQ
jgi:hypothetical protein